MQKDVLMALMLDPFLTFDEVVKEFRAATEPVRRRETVAGSRVGGRHGCGTTVGRRPGRVRPRDGEGFFAVHEECHL
jgi:hypothetical protein